MNTTRTNRQSFVGIALMFLVAGMMHTSAWGQEVGWNRKAAAIAIVPDGTGGFSVVPYIQLSATVPDLNLATSVMLSQNGSVFGFALVDAASISSSLCQLVGLVQVCFGHACGCGFVHSCWSGELTCPDLPTPAPPVPGDSFTLTVSAGPGGAPEIFTQDDELTISFSGQPVFWNRRVHSLNIKPVSDGMYDVDVTWDVGLTGLSNVDLSTEITIEVNGETRASASPCDAPLHWPELGQCSPTCGPSPCGIVSCSGIELSLVCAQHEGPVSPPIYCACTTPHITSTLQQVRLSPGEVATVRLRPADGALPNLEMFAPQSVATVVVPAPCPGDINGDGVIGVADLLQMLNCWGPVIPGCQGADLNGDNVVGVADLLQLLAQWGPCVP